MRATLELRFALGSPARGGLFFGLGRRHLRARRAALGGGRAVALTPDACAFGLQLRVDEVGDELARDVAADDQRGVAVVRAVSGAECGRLLDHLGVDRDGDLVVVGVGGVEALERGQVLGAALAEIERRQRVAGERLEHAVGQRMVPRRRTASWRRRSDRRSRRPMRRADARSRPAPRPRAAERTRADPGGSSRGP